MSGKLIHNQFEKNQNKNLNQKLFIIYNLAVDIFINETGRKKTKFPRALKKYVLHKTDKKVDIEFSNKDVKRILYPLQKKEYTKHTIEIVYYLLDYLCSKESLPENFNNVHIITIIQETFDIISRMNDVLEMLQIADNILIIKVENLDILQRQEDRIKYFMDTSLKYIDFDRGED